MNQTKDFVIRARVDGQLFGVVKSLAQESGTNHSTALRSIVREFGQRCGILAQRQQETQQCEAAA